MTDADLERPLTADQKTVLDEVAALREKNNRDATRNMIKWSIGFAVATLAAPLFPGSALAAFAGLAGQVYSFFKGWDLLGNAGRDSSLNQTAKEALSGTDFAPSTERARKLKDTAGKVFKATLGLVGAAIGLTLLSPVVPLLATGFGSALVGTLFVGGVLAIAANSYYEGAKDALNATSAPVFGRDIPKGDAPETSAPSALSSTPSPAPGFGLAANANTAAPAVTDDAPKAKAEELKP